MKITSAKFVKGIIGENDILYDGIPQIAFVGRSNVGKSSVINALLNEEELVKTGKRPGKTTEINFFLINKSFYCVDLPGYGYARLSPAEKEKIRKRMLWYLMESDVKPALIILVLDIKAGVTDFDKQMLELLREEGHPYIIIANKTDKLNQKEISHQLRLIKIDSGEVGAIPFSAVTKFGTDEVLKLISAGIDIAVDKIQN